MRVKLMKCQIDQLIANGIDGRKLPKPRPDSNVNKPASTRVSDADAASKRPNYVGATPAMPKVQQSQSIPISLGYGKAFAVIAIIIALFILLSIIHSAHGEPHSISTPKLSSPLTANNSTKKSIYTDNSSRNPKINDGIYIALTNVLNKINRLDNRVDAMVDRDKELAENNQRQFRKLYNHISSVSNACIAAVSINAESISNSLYTTGKRISSSLQMISNTQDFTSDHSCSIKYLLYTAVAILLFISILLLLHICLPQLLKSLSARRPSTAVRSPSATLPAILQSQDSLPVPEQTLTHLLHCAHDNPDVRIKPQVSPEGWKVGFCTSKGPFRQNNQDYDLVFGIGDRLAAIVSDGVAGLPSGAEASCCAVTAAASHIIYHLGRCPAEDALPYIVHQAMLSASHALTDKALNDKKHGLRTTLAIVVATPNKYYAESIGDSQFVVVRKDGKVEMLVEPQRVPGALLNVLAASLGPVIEGESQPSSLPVLPGDMLIGGTDGLWNIVDDEFPKALLTAAKQFQGDIQHIADTVVRNLTEDTDPLRLPCKDNLTIALAYRNDATGGELI